MITVICGTHRPQNQTRLVVEKYAQLLQAKGESFKILQMDELPQSFLTTNTFGEPSHGLDDIVAEKIIPAEKLVVISPEYNGSYPGILKVFIDAVDPKVWKGKKIALVGVASGRAGNLRGMDHLTDVLHHLRAEVFSYKVPISKLFELVEDNQVTDSTTEKVLQQQIDEFAKY